MAMQIFARSKLLAAFLFSIFFGAGFSSQAAAAIDLVAGQKTYQAICASCHGSSGRADPQDPLVQALGVLPADFTDPLFNSREPTEDWQLVVQYGGAALGLSELMPAHDGVLSVEEIRDVVAYIKTFADTRAYPPGEFNLFLPIRTKKAFPEDEVVWKSRYTSRDGRDVRRNVLEFEKRLGKAGQGLLEIIHEDDGSKSELKAVQIGYKQALNWDLERGQIVSGALLLELPTVSGEKPVIIPQLAFGKFLPADWLLQASARALLPTDDLDDGALELASAVHWAWSVWPRRIFPGIELTATVPFSARGADKLQWTVVPQLRWGLTRGGHVALNLGMEIPLNDQPYDRRYHLNLLWDFADGSFFQGW